MIVVQEWVGNVTLMQQTVLLTALRGPDGIDKNHVSKLLVRWLRRCVLLSAFDRAVLALPYDEYERRGGSFTGASIGAYFHGNTPSGPGWMFTNYDGSGRYLTWQHAMNDVVDRYMKTLDALPHHFQLHFLHAAEILGYKHPVVEVRKWWRNTYERLCNDMHLNPETEDQLNFRLADNESSWRAKEEVRAD